MVRSYWFCYFFLMISLLLYTFASSTLHQCRRDQRDALLEFKDEFPSPHYNQSAKYPCFSSWNNGSDCCSWECVTCDAKNGVVTSLVIEFTSLNSSFKSNSGLFKLQYLRNLTLRSCDLYGQVPASIGNLSRLTLLDFSSNKLVGQVPASIGNLFHLTLLDLSDNKLVGPFPPPIGNLTKLRYLNLASNIFSGNIPHSFANLTKLIQFIGHNNYFESTLPLDMSGFQNLEYIDVYKNSFTGPFPTSLFTIPSLIRVSLEGNQFEGPIEFRNTSSSSKLQFLYLAYNNFDGRIPKSISKLLNLKDLDLGDNNFSGKIPTSMSNLVKLEFISLSNNKLEGEIPYWIWRLTMVKLYYNSFSSFEKPSDDFNETRIRAVSLHSNSFRGPFPNLICKLRSLEILVLSNNLFNGSIPPCLWNSTNNLSVLILRNNSFSGTLPDKFVNGSKLQALDVSRNQLEGKLPKSLVNIKTMELLNVEKNKIKDIFPSWLGSLPSLSVLSLRSNHFHGPLFHHDHVSNGFQNLRIIDLSHNYFTGVFPAFYISNWRKMTTPCKEYEKTYMGSLTHAPRLEINLFYHNSMEMVHKGVDMKFERIRSDFIAIDFSENRFFGMIPNSIGLLKELRLLNLSGNAFTSIIPHSLANLTKLEELDLSRNQLSGQIPQDLSSLSFLSTMNFSHNNLEGHIPRGTQFQRQDCSSFMDNPKLYGLDEICGETHVPSHTQQELSSEPEEQVINWIAAGIAYVPGVFCGLVIGYIFASHKNKWFIKMFR